MKKRFRKQKQRFEKSKSKCQIIITWKQSGAVVINTAQLHLTKPELRFCTGSKPACDMLEILDGEDLWQ